MKKSRSITHRDDGYLSAVYPVRPCQACKAHVIRSHAMFCFIDANHLFNKMDIPNIEHLSTFTISGERNVFSHIYDYKRVPYQLRGVKTLSLLIRIQHPFMK